MKKFILILIFIFTPIISYGAVSQFVFITDSQSVLPNTISKDIKIQSQNSSLAEENVTETFDIVFQSSSPTGEFLNSSGNAVSKTMSKNTSNRTFYYRDSSLGEHTMTVVFTGRDSKQTFTATQKIKIENNTTQNQTQSQSQSQTSGNTESESSHSSQSSASINSDEVKFDVSIGRDRFSSVGNELSFKADITKLSGVSEQYIQYNWSFGDGSKGQGRIVSHKYKFAGEYNVVLNAVFSDKSAVSRVKVSVIEPVIEARFVSGGIEILNKSTGEINLGNWTIENGNQRFVIPEDTIVGVSKKVIFPNDIVNIFGKDLTLFNPLGQSISKITKTEDLKSVSTTTLQVPPVKIDNKVLVKKEVPKKIASITKTEKPKADIIKKSEGGEISSSTNSDNVNNTAIVYMAKPKTDVFGGMFSWFKNIFVKR